MSDNPEISPESIIVIRFAQPNSTLMDIRYNNVSPLQSIAAAFALKRQAEKTINEIEEEKQKQQSLSKIAVPGRG